MSMVEYPPSFLRSLWTYQRERFPLAVNGIMVACLTVGVMGYPHVLGAGLPAPGHVLAVAVTALLTFLLMRLLDEFKDAADDAEHRPYRPVPRGLISLRAIGWLAAAVVAVQILVQWIWLPERLFWLALVYGYLVLMTVEFGVPRWLKRHHMLYAASHMMVMPIIGLYLTAGWRAGSQAIALYGLLFAAGCVAEVGRKLRVPGREERGVTTYSALLGPARAAFLWLASVFVTAVLTLGLLHSAGVAPCLNVVLAAGLAGCAVCGTLYVCRLAPGDDMRIERVSGLWLVLAFASLAVGAYAPALSGVTP